MPSLNRPLPNERTRGSVALGAGERTAVELAMSLCGLVYDPQIGGSSDRVFAARVPLTVLEQLGVAPNAVRLALARHVRLGLLSPSKVGREVVYTITDAAVRVFSDIGVRMHGADPLSSTSAVWTLVSFAVREDRRELRSRLRIHLGKCGFRPLRDGLWIALEPFAADRLTRNLDQSLNDNVQLDVFIGTPYASTELPQLIRRSWDVDDLRSRHERFLTRWEHVNPAGDQALAALTSFTADWVALLNHDPGLPPDHLDGNWPGVRSRATAARLYVALREPAGAALGGLLRKGGE